MDGADIVTSEIREVEDLRVFQSFCDLARNVESLTRHFPYDFKWLRIQLLRASESVLANLTEGFYSQYSTEYLQCLYRCRREARETMTHLAYAIDVGQMASNNDLRQRYENTLIQLNALINRIEQKIAQTGKSKPGGYVRESSGEYDVEEDYLVLHQPLTPNL